MITNITKQQANERYEIIPNVLKEALFSMRNANEVYNICQSHHLPEEKIPMVSRLTGRVIFGFIHFGDLAKEIRLTLNLNSEIANSISREIDRKIFAPIRSELQKVYSPIFETERPVMAEIKKVEKIKEVEIPKSETEAEHFVTETEPLKINLSDEEKKESGKEEAKEIKPEIKIEPEIQLPQPETLEGPLIIHKEAEFKPLSGTKKSLGGLFGFLKKKETKAEERVSPVKAQVEISNNNLKPLEVEPRKIIETGAQKPRIVHYTEFRTPISPFGQSAEAVGQKVEKIKPEIQQKVEEVKKPIEVFSRIEAAPKETAPKFEEIKLPIEIIQSVRPIKPIESAKPVEPVKPIMPSNEFSHTPNAEPVKDEKTKEVPKQPEPIKPTEALKNEPQKEVSYKSMPSEPIESSRESSSNLPKYPKEEMIDLDTFNKN